MFYYLFSHKTTMNVSNNYTCKFCYREYIRKTNFERHVLVCELIKKSNRTDEEYDIPSTEKLYKIILELAKKNDELEKKVNQLTKWVEVKKKKINIIEWLNKNITPTITFLELTKKMIASVERKHLEKIFELGHIQGFSRVIYCLLDTLEEETLPIKAFVQKDNSLYVFNLNADKNEWSIMPNEIFNKFINDLSKQIMREFIAWKDENKHRIMNDDFAVECNTNLLKVLGGQMSIQEVNSKLKHNLYKHIKTNLKNVIEFDFTF